MEPSFGPRVALKQRRQFLPYFLMVCIHPPTFLHGEEGHIDKVPTHRRLSRKRVSMPFERRAKENKEAYHSDVLKSKVTLVAKVMWRLGIAYDNYALNAYAIISIGIVTRLCALCELINRTRSRYLPLDTVIPALNGVLLYAIRRV